MPRRLTSPLVGLMPTMPQALAGLTIEPSVSVPIASGASPAATPAADPELDPDGLRSSAYGFAVWPPRVDQPLVEWVERKLAHSDRFALPMITAPACAQPPDQEGVTGFGRQQGGRAGGGRHARDLDVVLDQHRNALERPPRAVHRARRVAGRRLGRGVRVDRDHRVQRRVQPLDALQVEAGQGGRAERARGQRGLQTRPATAGSR